MEKKYTLQIEKIDGNSQSYWLDISNGNKTVVVYYSNGCFRYDPDPDNAVYGEMPSMQFSDFSELLCQVTKDLAD